jgi:hypothetical protein
MSWMGYEGRGAGVGPRFSRCALATMVLAFASGTLAWNGAGPDWRMIGYESKDNRTQPFEYRIGVDNVSHLARKWVAVTVWRRFGDSGGCRWSSLLRRFRRHGMEAQRRHWRCDLVAQDFGLHRDRR